MIMHVENMLVVQNHIHIHVLIHIPAANSKEKMTNVIIGELVLVQLHVVELVQNIVHHIVLAMTVVITLVIHN